MIMLNQMNWVIINIKYTEYEDYYPKFTEENEEMNEYGLNQY